MKKLTLDVVVSRSHEIHGDVYVFDRAVYVDNITPMEVGCRLCGRYFTIRPCNHIDKINRSGCPDCKRGVNKLDVEEFVRRGKERYGESIDYSEAIDVYVDTTTKVPLRCSICDHRWMSIPSQHMSGRSGCVICVNSRKGREQALTWEECVERCRNVHGDEYDYPSQDYVNNASKLKIWCRRCQDFFFQSLIGHVGGKQGCPSHRYEKVRRALAMTFEEFVIRAEETHDHSYSYPLQEYVNSSTVVTIVCVRCDRNFEQTPVAHLSGQGCPRCAGNAPLTTDDFVRRSIEIWGETSFDRSRAVYRGAHRKLDLGCNVCHAWFQQTPVGHLHRRNGCPTCASRRRVSLLEKEWLDRIGLPDDPSHRQVRIEGTRYRVDGLEGKIVYEFNGTYYHGDPRVYRTDVINERCGGRTMGELYERTLQKQRRLEALGYEVKFVWERDYDAGLMFSPCHP